MNRIAVSAVLFLVAALTPAIAQANAGTPLMWAGAFHLLFGNALIGVGEGVILACLFRQKWLPCMGIMILANYFSAWIAAVVLIPEAKRLLDLDLHNTWQWLWGMVVLSYVITILLEWPFVAVCLRKCQGWLIKSIWGSVVVQAASYLIIFGWYWAVSGISLFTGTTIVEPSQIAASSNVLVYYISDADGNVCVLDLERYQSKKVCDLGSISPNDKLCVRKQHDETDRWDIVAATWSDNQAQPAVKTVVSGLGSTAVPVGDNRADNRKPSWFDIGKVPSLASRGSDGWEFETGLWSIEGLIGRNVGDGRTVRLSLETPFVEWLVRNATALPKGQVVFQLGRNQICIFDPDQRAIALLAKGWGPIAVIKD